MRGTNMYVYVFISVVTYACSSCINECALLITIYQLHLFVTKRFNHRFASKQAIT